MLQEKLVIVPRLLEPTQSEIAGKTEADISTYRLPAWEVYWGLPMRKIGVNLMDGMDLRKTSKKGLV